MKHTFNILIAISLWICLGLAACGQPQATVSPSQGASPTAPPEVEASSIPTPSPTEAEYQGTISIWHSLEEPDISTLVYILADFQKLYPDIQFDVLYLPEGILLERFMAATQENRGPMLLLGTADWAYPLVSEGLIQDLAPQLSPELVARLNQAALAVGKVGNIQAGLPYVIEGVVLYRNSSLVFDPPATWEDLLAQSLEATQGDQIGAFLDRGFYFSGAHLDGLGGQLMNPDGSPAFNNEKGVAWVRLLESFAQAGPTDFLTDQDIKRFKEGKVGFIIDTTANRGALDEAIGAQNLVIDPWPMHASGRLAGYLLPESIYLSASADDTSRRLAATFMQYMLSPEAQTRFADGGRIPAVNDIAPESELTRQAMKALRDSFPYPLGPYEELYRTALDAALQSVFNGSATPAEALAQAEKVILEALANNPSTPSPSP